MKKLILLLAVITLLISCAGKSKTTEETTFKSTDVGFQPTSELGVLYDEMIHSVSYLRFEKSGHQFIEKLNYKGDTSIMEDEKLMMEWIEANLKKTQFVSYDEAVSEWKQNVANLQAVLKENKAYFEARKKATPEEADKYPYIP
jgi:hypothetical protein